MKISSSYAVIAATFLCSAAANAVVIDNDVPAGTLGHWSVDVESGGQTRSGTLTANGAGSGTITAEVIFDYFSYISTAPGTGFQLSRAGAVTSTGDDQVSSGQSFTGSNGNQVNVSVASSIADGDPTLLNAFTFSVETGALGTIRLYQYLDEDVLGVSDDVFFTRGSSAGGDLQLFTIDSAEQFGVSHGGAYSSAQGLVSASFAGWAACTFDTMRGDLAGGTQGVSLGGDICAGLPMTSLGGIGDVFGPRDVVSVLAWDVTSTASSATILTTLGGLLSVDDIPPVDPGDVPEPAALGLLGIGLGALLSRRRRKAGTGGAAAC